MKTVPSKVICSVHGDMDDYLVGRVGATIEPTCLFPGCDGEISCSMRPVASEVIESLAHFLGQLVPGIFDISAERNTLTIMATRGGVDIRHDLQDSKIIVTPAKTPFMSRTGISVYDLADNNSIVGIVRTACRLLRRDVPSTGEIEERLRLAFS